MLHEYNPAKYPSVKICKNRHINGIGSPVKMRYWLKPIEYEYIPTIPIFK